MKLRSIAVAGALAIAGAAAGTTAPAQAQTSKCVNVVQTFDFQLTYCYDLRGDCVLTEKRYTKDNYTVTCLIPRPV